MSLNPNQIDKRWQKALKILELPDGIVQDIKASNHFLVRAETDPVLFYEVTFDPIYDENGKVIKYRGKCNCVDYMHRSNQDIEHRCKHILVYFVAKARGKPIRQTDVSNFIT
jgi:hypothetical protein